MEMTFNNIHKDTICNCLIGAKIDTDSTFGIKTNVTKIKEKDFRSKWEKGEQLLGDCRLICSLKGISVSIYEESKKEDLIRIFKELFPLFPNYRPYLNVIRFYDDAGMFKETPSYQNPFHYDFYKSDNFDYQKVLPIESISLANV